MAADGIFFLPNQSRRRLHTHRPVRKSRGVFARHREITCFSLVALFVVQLYVLQAWLFENDGGVVEVETAPPKGRRKSLAPCPSTIDVEALKAGLVCIEKCEPSANNTLHGLGLDPNERVNIFMPDKVLKHIAEYGKYRVHFPEENVDLNLTGRLSNAIKIQSENGNTILDNGHIHPRSITERLMRRIVAKLLRASVLDPSKKIVNTGSWIGDNALPWALMMEELRPENPGKVIAIDPSEMFVQDMVDLANVNGIGNLCARIGILSSNATRVAFTSGSMEHIKVQNEQQIYSGSIRKQQRFEIRGTWTNAIPLDSLNLHDSVSLLHLDVEGHEGQLLEGARATIKSSRPVIITEGYNIWDRVPEDENDRHVLKVMNELGYASDFEIPERVGVKMNARNRIWFPDEGTRDAAIDVVGKDLERELVPWIASDLQELD
eukprot:CAMPEP_0172548404 /NCGR_PEP_ID=MMETSP1067-20121228/17705_1 /TAXON_ID=265564 ORGANISM="Thalassiosira punctigera, Strain Tpunct2005C2" /NCGR_SAMPLE_ID=MMETSP1067 /ASSEMBLY_ACC=CAM_ASM_000444 /LENGTH=434 /DNA_ID=CAMNT_0013335615 /DNA_START=33 /DNA_END=1337 /DNA_ORIENTATION=-